MKKTVTIKSVFQNKTKAGKNYVTVITEDDLRIGVWSPEHFDIVREGKQFEIDIEERNGFLNAIDIVPVVQVDGDMDEADPEWVGNPRDLQASYIPPTQSLPKEVSIVRQSSHKTAVILLQIATELAKAQKGVEVEAGDVFDNLDKLMSSLLDATTVITDYVLTPLGDSE